MSIEAEKAALRIVLQQRREEAARRHRDAAQRLATTFPAELCPPPGGIASAYVGFRSELDPGPLLDRLAATGVRLALPRTPPKGVPAPLTFHLVQPGMPLERSGFGVSEPPAAAPQADPDLVIVPLLGFDRGGGRLGYGRGHYDRTLAALRARRRIVAVGVAFAEQEVAAVPQSATDARLDWVVTPEAAIRTGPPIN